MKKTLIFLGALGMGYVTYAQQGNVGINVEVPQATLDIKPSTANLNGTTNEGILAPRLTKARIANIATPVEGTLVYATDAIGGTGVRVAKITEKGYYYYDGTEWVKAGGAAGATLPVGTANNQVLKWNGTAWTPQADANTTYTGSTSVILRGISFERAALTGDVTSAHNNNTVTINNGAVTGAKIAAGTITADKLAPGVIPVAQAEVDGIIGNEVTNATANRGLVRAGSGTTAAPYTLGIADNGISTAMIANNAITAAKLNQMGATNEQVLKWNGTAWAPAADTDTNTTYTAGQAIDITSNKISVKAPIRTVTASVTLAATDDNGYVYVDAAGATTVTIPSTLPAGFSCIIVQQGAGQVTIEGNGVILRTARGLKTRTQYSAVGIIKRTTAEATITGDAIN